MSVKPSFEIRGGRYKCFSESAVLASLCFCFISVIVSGEQIPGCGRGGGSQGMA